MYLYSRYFGFKGVHGALGFGVKLSDSVPRPSQPWQPPWLRNLEQCRARTEKKRTSAKGLRVSDLGFRDV